MARPKGSNPRGRTAATELYVQVVWFGPEEDGRHLGRTADLPLDERRGLEVEKERELQDGLIRRHLHIAAYDRAYVPLLLSSVRRWHHDRVWDLHQ